MFRITDENGWYLCSWLFDSPVWTKDAQDAKAYASVEDTASDEMYLEKLGIKFFIVPA